MSIIKIYEEQIARIQERISNIKRDCQHRDVERIRELSETDSYWMNICKNCGLEWREHNDDS